MAMGINWWQSDPHLNAHAKELQEENMLLRERLDKLETLLGATPAGGAHGG